MFKIISDLLLEVLIQVGANLVLQLMEKIAPWPWINLLLSSGLTS